jgi:antirestriction protein
MEPKIYVADLAAYNAGKLRGVWIDADQDAETIQEEINRMLRQSPESNVLRCQDCFWEFGKITKEEHNGECIRSQCPKCGGHIVRSAEEWAIHDTEGFGEISIGEGEDIDTIAELGELLTGENGEAFAVYYAHVGGCDQDNFEEAYCGEHNSEREYAEELADDVFDIPKDIAPYFDYEAFARDLFITDYFSEDCSDGGVFVFRHV